MVGVWLVTLTVMALAALAGTRAFSVTTYRGRILELSGVSVIFAVGWLSRFPLAWLDPVRVSALIVASYVFARIGAANESSAAHLLPCLALTVGAIAKGSMSPGTCLLPMVVGLVASSSPRWAAITTFVALAQAVTALG